MGCHFLHQGIFLTQGSNPSLLHCRQTLYCLSQQGSPYFKWITNKDLLYSTRNSAQGHGQPGWERVWGRMDTCIPLNYIYIWCGHLEVKSSGLREFLKVIYTPHSIQATQTSRAEFPRSRIQSPVTGLTTQGRLFLSCNLLTLLGSSLDELEFSPQLPLLTPILPPRVKKQAKFPLPCNIHSRNSF